MAKKIVGVGEVQYDDNGRVKKVTITDQTPSRAASRSSGGRHGDFQKDGLGSRIVDGILGKLGK